MDEIREKIAEYNEEALLADGFDEAIIGIVSQGGTSNFLILYDSERCIEVIIEQLKADEVEPEEGYSLRTMAIEHFDFNVSGSYMGENTPVFLTRLDEF